MMEKIRRSLKAIPIVFPMLLLLYFFGYLTPSYDITLSADNIVGEGSCIVNTSAPRTYSHYYSLYAPFNTEQSKIVVKDVHYDVSAFDFTFAGISEADFQNYEVRWLGILLAHNDFKDIFKSGQYGNVSISPSLDGEIVHIEVDEPEAGFSLKVKIDYVSRWMWLLYWTVFIVLVCIISFGVGLLLDRFPTIMFHLTGLMGIVTALLAGCFFCNSFPDVDYVSFLLNSLLLFGVSLIIGALTTPLLGYVIVICLTLLLYIVNYYTILFRGRPVMPADLSAMDTAREVLDGYEFVFSWQMILGIIVSVFYVIWIVILWKLQKKNTKQKETKLGIKRRFIIAVLGLLLLITCVNIPILSSIDRSTWDSKALYNFHRNGMLLSFVVYAKNSVVTRPEGYSREVVNEYLEEYLSMPEDEIPKDSIQPTNIIMIMNEAFSDLRTAGMDKRIDVMPFIDSLQKNTVDGDLYVSVIGGGTCNTEFETLTGNTLAFLGASSYPYTRYVTQELFSLASYFRDMGYLTNAFHANEARNWNRNKVYPKLGFDKFYSIDDYPDAIESDYFHGYYSDSSNYRFLESIVEKNAGIPRFSFNVTMQNHSGYDLWKNLDEAETVKKFGNEMERDAKVYLSLIKASDDAVKQLVETYKNSNEPTMIIFFGDHQPSLSYEAGLDIYGQMPNSWSLLTTKFFIWTNYESEAEHEMSISASFMPWLVLERGGFSLPPFIRMLKEVHEKYPVITTGNVIDAEGRVYDSILELKDDPLIRKYQYVQYANLFDEIDPAWFEVD